MRLWLVVVMLAACGDSRQIKRWPEHRRMEDQRMLVLEQKAKDLERRIAELERVLRDQQGVINGPDR